MNWHYQFTLILSHMFMLWCLTTLQTVLCTAAGLNNFTFSRLHNKLKFFLYYKHKLELSLSIKEAHAYDRWGAFGSSLQVKFAKSAEGEMPGLIVTLEQGIELPLPLRP